MFVALKGPLNGALDILHRVSKACFRFVSLHLNNRRRYLKDGNGTDNITTSWGGLSVITLCCTETSDKNETDFARGADYDISKETKKTYDLGRIRILEESRDDDDDDIIGRLSLDSRFNMKKKSRDDDDDDIIGRLSLDSSIVDMPLMICVHGKDVISLVVKLARNVQYEEGNAWIKA
ncbi:hypothetical protein Tco_0369070 [Tanacetum coccineum]